jgi:hypothetical protein
MFCFICLVCSIDTCQGKDELCQCGCRGWCTLYFLIYYTSWDFICGADGVGSQEFPFGVRFDPEDDASLCALRGQNLCVRLVVVEFRGDWPAWSDVSGIRQWGHKQYPCPTCDCPKSAIKDLTGVTLCSVPFETYDEDAFERDVAFHEIVAGLRIVWFRCVVMCQFAPKLTPN